MASSLCLSSHLSLSLSLFHSYLRSSLSLSHSHLSSSLSAFLTWPSLSLSLIFVSHCIFYFFFLRQRWFLFNFSSAPSASIFSLFFQYTTLSFFINTQPTFILFSRSAHTHSLKKKLITKKYKNRCLTWVISQPCIMSLAATYLLICHFQFGFATFTCKALSHCHLNFTLTFFCPRLDFCMIYFTASFFFKNKLIFLRSV